MGNVEAKRMEAIGLTGVNYDARSNKFTAEIYIDGKRQWLGSYSTAEEAFAKYLEARKARGPIRRGTTSFAHVYTAFRQSHGGDRTDPPIGARLEYDGQVFTYTGDAWRHGAGGRNFRYAVWNSKCKTCGVDYETMAPHSPSIAKGITRNCEDHTKGRPARRALAPGKVENGEFDRLPGEPDWDALAAGTASPDAFRPEPVERAPDVEPPKVTTYTIAFDVALALWQVTDRMPAHEFVARVVAKLPFSAPPENVEKGLRKWADGELPAAGSCPFVFEGDTVVLQEWIEGLT